MNEYGTLSPAPPVGKYGRTIQPCTLPHSGPESIGTTCMSERQTVPTDGEEAHVGTEEDEILAIQKEGLGVQSAHL